MNDAKIDSQDMSECLSAPLRADQWFIEKLMTAGSKTLLVGGVKLGKTWLLLHLIVCMLNKKLFFGHRVQSGNVLFLEAENSEHSIYRRIHALCKNTGIERLHGLSGSFKKSFDIVKEKNALINEIKAKNHKLVIFDSLRRFHRANENDSQEMANVLAAFDEIIEKTGVNILIVYHENKNWLSQNSWGRVRGSGDIVAWIDQLWHITPKSKSIKFTAKLRDGADVSFTYDRVADGDSVKLVLTEKKTKNKADKFQQRMKHAAQLWAEAGPRSQTALLKMLPGGNTSPLNKQIWDKTIIDGIIVEDQIVRGTTLYRYGGIK